MVLVGLFVFPCLALAQDDQQPKTEEQPKPAPPPAAAPKAAGEDEDVAPKKKAPPSRKIEAAEGKKLKPQDLEKAMQEEMDKRNGVVREVLPVTETDGVPTDKLGSTLPEIKAFPVATLLDDPELFDGQRVKVRGLVKRMSLTGAWLEVAEYKSAASGIRILPMGGEWKFFWSDRERRVTAYGLLKRRKLDSRGARILDEESGQKPKGGARMEWVLEAEGAEVQWID